MGQKTVSRCCPFKTESVRVIQAFLDGELHDELDEFPGDLSLLLRERTKLMLKLDRTPVTRFLNAYSRNTVLYINWKMLTTKKI
jgi:hypothetical protein